MSNATAANSNEQRIMELETPLISSSNNPGTNQKKIHHLSLRSTTNLEHLVTSTTSLSSELSTCQRLVVVCPGCEPDWSLPSVTDLFVALSKLPELEEVKLNCVGLLDVAFPVHLLTRILLAPNLGILELDDIALSANGTEDFEDLSDAIRQHETLQEFRLFGCLAGEAVESQQSLDPLLKAVSTLKLVEIDAVDDGLLGGIQGETLRVMGHSSSLQKLHLNGFSLNNNCVESLSESIANNTSLEDVSFDLYCGAPGKGAFSLCDALRFNQHLLRLHISISHDWNQDAFLMAMADSLKTNCTLKSLIVGAISVISDNAAKAFAEMLLQNTVMELLQLSRYKGDWKPTLHYYLKLNSQGRGHFLQHCEEIPRKEWVEVLAKSGGDLDVNFYFLQLNPLLCSTAAMAM